MSTQVHKLVKDHSVVNMWHKLCTVLNIFLIRMHDSMVVMDYNFEEGIMKYKEFSYRLLGKISWTK